MGNTIVVREDPALGTLAAPSSAPEYFDARAPKYWRELYEGDATNHHQLLLRRRRDLVVDMLKGTAGPALELGCGPGILIEALSAAGEVYLGDIAFSMVQQAKRRTGKPASTVAQFSAGAIPFRSGSLSLVTAMGLLEYVDDERACLQEIRRVLAPDGTAIITFPARKPVEYLVRDVAGAAAALWRRVRGTDVQAGGMTPKRDREHSGAAASRMLEESGFIVEEMRGFHFFFYPWSRVFFGASRVVDRSLDRAQRTIPLARHAAQSWVVKVRKP